MRRELIIEPLQRALRESLSAPELTVVSLTGERPAVDETREPWIPIKYGRADPDNWFGVVPATVRFARARGTVAESLELIVKVNPRQGLSQTLIPWIIKNEGIALDRPYSDYRAAAECDHTGPRELHVYQLSRSTPALKRVLPGFFGNAVDPETGEHALFMESLTGVTRLDATGASADWPVAMVDAALGAAAAWQTTFWNATHASLPWAAPRPTTEDMIADAPLWQGLLDDSRRRFPHIVTEQAWRRRHGLIDTLADWHRMKDSAPATLSHNDFNQRNVGFRPAVVVLDWELVQVNTAQRDLVELLTFVLPSAADRARIDGHVETHRMALVDAGVGIGTDRDAWFEVFRREVRVEAINRVGLQLLFAAMFPLAYLARINATVEHLLDLYE